MRALDDIKIYRGYNPVNTLWLFTASVFHILLVQKVVLYSIETR